jgi:hypothetical protein
MKGYAVQAMNQLAGQPDFQKHNLPVQFPVEMKQIHGYQVFLVNGASGLIWRKGISKEYLREKDALKVFNEDSWAFLSVHIVDEPHKFALQKLLFPQFAPYIHVIEIFADWQEAVYNTVMQAASAAWSKKIIAAKGSAED